MENNSFPSIYDQADRLTTRQGKRDKKEVKAKKKKKDVGSSSLKLRVPPQVAASQTNILAMKPILNANKSYLKKT